MKGKAIRETVGFLAVVAGLLFVGIEIRQNTNAVRGATFQELVHGSGTYLMTLAQNPALVSIMQRGNTDPSALSEVERLQYFYTARTYWRNHENSFLQNERGLLGDEEWRIYHNVICQSSQSLRLTWDEHSPALTSEFRSLVEACWRGTPGE